MKIIPGTVPPQVTNFAAEAAAKARAVDAFMRSQTQSNVPQEHPVANPSQVAPEEMSAIRSSASEKASTEVVQSIETKEENSVYTPKEEPKKHDDNITKQMELLARREKALRAKVQQQERTIKQREEALQAREAELTSKYIPKEQLETEYVSKARLKQQTLQALAEAEVSYDDITQQQIEAANVNPHVDAHIKRLEAQIQKMNVQIEESKKAQELQQDNSYKAAIKQITIDAQSLVKSNPEFETVRATNSVKDVVELIETTFKEEGRVMSVEEAAQEVESYLVEEIDKLTRLEKIKKRISQVAPNKLAEQKPQDSPKQPQSMKTLTNAATSTRTLGAKERAILAFRGELK
jgi:hypothetical protein